MGVALTRWFPSTRWNAFWMQPLLIIDINHAVSVDLHVGIVFYMISKSLIWCLMSHFLYLYGLAILKKFIALTWFGSTKVSAGRSLADWKGPLPKVNIPSLIVTITAIGRNRKSVSWLIIFNRWFWFDSGLPINLVTLWVLIINFYLWSATEIEAIGTDPVMLFIPSIFVFTFRGLQ